MEWRRKNIGEQQEVIFPFVQRSPRKFQAIEIRMWNQHKFCLAAFVRSHTRVPVSSRSALRIHGQASVRISAVAVKAISTSNVKGENNPVSFLDALDRFT